MTRVKSPNKTALLRFVEPMQCLPVHELPEGEDWTFEVKWDGYRALAVGSAGKVFIYSRNEKRLDQRFPSIVQGLSTLPGSWVIDGEVVAFDENGRPSFQLLQNSRTSPHGTAFYAFDLIHINGVNLQARPLKERRKLLDALLRKPVKRLLAGERTAVRTSPELKASGQEAFASIKELGLEGIIGKRSGGRYEAGERSGSWIKMRANKGQELVIGGYVPGTHEFESLVVGFYRGKKLMYAARIKNGFVPRIRAELFPLLKARQTTRCPFANLPEDHRARFGEALTAEKMAECRWVRPDLVCQVAFLEWTDANHLRHASFVAMREDKNAKCVVRES